MNDFVEFKGMKGKRIVVSYSQIFVVEEGDNIVYLDIVCGNDYMRLMVCESYDEVLKRLRGFKSE